MLDGFSLGDGLAAELACGHPNVQPNEQCPLCGKIVQEQQVIEAKDVASVEEVLGLLKEKERERL